MSLKIELRRTGPYASIVALSGRFTLGCANRDVEHVLNRLIAEKAKLVVLDLSSLVDIDATGVGLIAHWLGELRHSGGVLHIAAATGIVREVLTIVHIDTLVRFFATTKEACDSFRVTQQACA